MLAIFGFYVILCMVAKVVIYKITNRLNGKPYVGQTKQSIEKRFLQHSKANSPLGQAMRRCGLENFTIEVIEECETPEQARERERLWIKVLKSKIPNGYNRSSGGEGQDFIHKTDNVKRNAMRLGEIIREYRLSNHMSMGDFAMLELFRRIRIRREELGISQEELAKKVGYKSRSSINKIEMGKNDITQSKIMEIADALATTPEYLMGWTSEVSSRNKDEAELVNGYRSLNDESKRLIKDMIRQLNFVRVQSVNQAMAM